jgi:hypothetical protein
LFAATCGQKVFQWSVCHQIHEFETSGKAFKVQDAACDAAESRTMIKLKELCFASQHQAEVLPITL